MRNDIPICGEKMDKQVHVVSFCNFHKDQKLQMKDQIILLPPPHMSSLYFRPNVEEQRQL